MAANAFNISLVISAVLSGTFGSAISGARSGLDKIGKGTEELTRIQRRMGDVMSQSLAHPMRNVGALRDRYDRLGASIKAATREQERMAAAMNRMTALKQQRGELRGDLMDKVATGYAVGAPLTQSVRIASSFEDQIKDMAITANMTRQNENRLGKALRQNAQAFNQTQDELARGTGILIANGMSPQDAQRYSGILGKTATATRGQMEELAQFIFSLNTSFKISGESDMKAAIDAAAHAGKQGQFELKHMARYFPELGASMASFGATGLNAVKELGMAMQVARKYSGTNEEAARNAANWFGHMTAGSTTKHFGDVGIDYQGELMKRMREQKISALQASLQVTDSYIDKVAGGQTISVKDGKKTKKVSFREALDAAKASGNESEIKSVVERFGLSKVFQDMQTVNFYMAMRQGKDMFKQGMASFDTADAKNVVDRDFEKRMQSSVEQFKAFKVASAELGINIGGLLLPSLNGLLRVIKPVIDTAGKIATAFPNTTKTVIGLAVGLTAGGIALAGFGFLSNMAATSLATLKVGIHGARAAVALLQGAAAAGYLGPLVTGIRTATIAMRAFSLSLLTNPIGWIALAIGLAALVIYKYWKPISGFFRGMWTGLKEGLKGLAPAWDIFKRVAPILFPILVPLKWIFNLVKALVKPVDDVGGKAENMGLRFGKAIGRILSSVLQLPAKMLTAGANIIDSLFKGMMSKVEKPINVMKGLATRIRGFLPFSPAKEGALRDINRIRLVETIAESIKPQPMVQAMKMATAATMIAAAPAMGMTQPADTTSRPAVASLARPISAGQGSAPITIHFAPQITVQGGGDPASVKGAVMEASRASQVELERMIERILAQKQRRSF